MTYKNSKFTSPISLSIKLNMIDYVCKAPQSHTYCILSVMDSVLSSTLFSYAQSNLNISGARAVKGSPGDC